VYIEVSETLSSSISIALYADGILINEVKTQNRGYLFRVERSGNYVAIVNDGVTTVHSNPVMLSAEDLQPREGNTLSMPQQPDLSGQNVFVSDCMKFHLEIKIQKGTLQQLEGYIQTRGTPFTLIRKELDVHSFPDWHSIHQYEYILIAQPLTQGAAMTLCDELETLDNVLYATPVPDAEKLSPPRNDNFSAFDKSEPLATTPDFSGDQRYLDSGKGLNVRTVWKNGNTGKLAVIRHMDFGLYRKHEDFQGGNVHVVNSRSESEDCNHGTASVGCIGAAQNGIGVTGIAYSAALYFYDTGDLNKIQEQANPGDIVSMNIQWNTSNGYIPALGIKSWWDAIRNLTEKQVIVIMAAGNGNNDLSNSAICPDFGDSGGILVGSCSSVTGRRLGSSNFGHPASLINAWGDSVTTTGYGTLQTGPGHERDYCNNFSGTSSATPQCAAALALLQSHAKSRGILLTPDAIKRVIKASDYQEAKTDRIGFRPNVAQLVTLVDALSVNSLDASRAFTPETSALNLNANFSTGIDNETMFPFDYRRSGVKNIGFVAHYPQEGPANLEWCAYGETPFIVPVKNSKDEVSVVNLKLSKWSAGGHFTVNSAADTYGGSPDNVHLVLSMRAEDNTCLRSGTWQGTLPMYVTSWNDSNYRLPLRLNIVIS